MTAPEQEQSLLTRLTYVTPPFPWGDIPEENYYRQKRVDNCRSFMKSSRGISLFTQSWIPIDHAPRAVICMVHGYGNNISWTFQNTALLFTDMGYAAFAMDMEGHGKSEGLPGFVPDVHAVTNDFQEYFRSVIEREEFHNLPRFLYGESLGGAICLLLHFLDPEAWNGAILAAAMCKISDNMRPIWPIGEILICLSGIFPTWGIVPSKDLVDKSFTHPVKKELGRNNPGRYAGKPRLGTVAEFLRLTRYLERRLQDVRLPVLIIHGDADGVTEPAVSQELYAKAKSRDKTLKLYKGMRHSLLQGETDENVAILLADISYWLRDRVDPGLKGSQGDRQ